MKQLKADGLNHMSGSFLPDGKHFVFSGNESGHGARLYLESLDDAKPHPFSMEGVGRRGNEMAGVVAGRQARRGPRSGSEGVCFPVAEEILR